VGGYFRFLDPIYRGDYPAVMRKNVGNRLPVFTPQELALLKGSLDFIGLNHYTSRWISSGHLPEDSLLSDNWQDQGLQAFGTRSLLLQILGSLVHEFETGLLFNYFLTRILLGAAVEQNGTQIGDQVHISSCLLINPRF